MKKKKKKKKTTNAVLVHSESCWGEMEDIGDDELLNGALLPWLMQSPGLMVSIGGRGPRSRAKKARNFGPPTLGAPHPSGPHWGLAPGLYAKKKQLKKNPNNQKTKKNPNNKFQTSETSTLPKIGLAKVGVAEIGRIMMAKVGLAKVGFDRGGGVATWWVLDFLHCCTCCGGSDGQCPPFHDVERDFRHVGLNPQVLSLETAIFECGLFQPHTFISSRSKKMDKKIMEANGARDGFSKRPKTVG